MLQTLIQAFTSRMAGPVGFALAALMCGLLIVTASTAARTEARLRARVAELTLVNQRDAAVLHAKLAACEGAAPGTLPRTLAGAPTANLSAEDRAQRLAEAGPAGFDVCARMESADRAVLETLK